MTDTPFYSHGLDYRSLGWPVFPVGKNKHPMCEHGVKDATTDGDQIDVWREAFPAANIAVACGETSGITVIDIDGEAGERGVEFLAKHHGGLSKTVEAASGNGRHLYYRYERGLKNWAGVPAANIDIRTSGGSIIVPPSIHKSGREYCWLNSPHDTELAPLPLWIVHKIARDQASKRLAGLPKRGAPPRDIGHWLRELTRAPKGQRNHELNRISFIVGVQTSKTKADPLRAIDSLITAARQIGLPTIEARVTAKSGFEAGYRS